MKNDPSSYERKKKNSELWWDLNPWPRDTGASLQPTKLWSHWCYELVSYVFINCVHNCKDHSSFDSISVVLIILYDLFHIHLSHKNNVRTNSKENTSRLLTTLKIQVDGQGDKNNEHNGMKNTCLFLFFLLLWPLGLTAMKWNANNFKGAY